MAGGSYKQQCPSCETMVLIKDPAKMVGKKIDCPQCKYRFLVEKPAGNGEDEEEPKAKGSQAVTSKKPAPGPSKPQLKKKGAPKKRVDDDEDAPESTEKEPTGSRVMMMMIGVSVLAVGLLGVGGYFLFFNTTEPNTPTGPIVSRPVIKKPVGPEVVPAKLGMEVTNLLPNDSQLVLNFSFKELYNSKVGQAAFEAPGAFTVPGVEKKLGLKIPDIDRVLVAANTSKPWTFIILQTSKPVDAEAFKKTLDLKKAGEIKGREYFQTSEPTDWLSNLERTVVEGVPNAKAPEVKPQVLFVRVMDLHTLIVADEEGVVKAFLNDEEKPAAVPDVAGGQPKKDAAASKRYLTVDPRIKQMLDRVEAKPVLASVGWLMDVLPIEAMQKQLKQSAVVATFKAFNLDASKMADKLGPKEFLAGALGLQFKETIEVYLAILNRDEEDTKFWQNSITDLLRVPPISDGLKRAETAGYTLKQQPPQSQIHGATWTVDPEFKTTLPIGEAVESVLRPPIVMFRAMSEMTGNKSHVGELAQALKDYVAKTGQFPRGTVDRKLPQNRTRPFDPIDRVSWMAEMLPFLGDSAPIHKEIDFNASPREGRNAEMGGIPIPAFLAAGYPQSRWFKIGRTPTGEVQRLATTHFIGVAGVGPNAAEYDAKEPRAGVFGYDRVTKPADITDGLDSTIAILQAPPTFRQPWIAGGGATVQGVPLTKSVQPFVCVVHKDKPGTIAIMADGSVRFIPATIADAAFQALCTIHGGEKVDLNKETELYEVPNQAVLKAKQP